MHPSYCTPTNVAAGSICSHLTAPRRWIGHKLFRGRKHDWVVVDAWLSWVHAGTQAAFVEIRGARALRNKRPQRPPRRASSASSPGPSPFLTTIYMTVADLHFNHTGTDKNDIVHQHGHNIIRLLNDDKIVVNIECWGCCMGWAD